MSSPPPAAAKPRRERWWPVLLAIAVLAAGFAGWVLLVRKPPANPVAAAGANARGIGYMGQFEERQPDGKRGYDKAAEAFEEASRYAPDWTPAKINLGIALLNMRGDADLARASKIFEEVLKKEPDNPHAHFCLGVIHEYQGRVAEANKHFTEVTRIDPADPHAWYYRAATHPDKDNAAESKAFYRKALDLDPNFNSARYALVIHGHDYDVDKSKQLLEEHRRLHEAGWERTAGLKYTERGKYAECIGTPPGNPPAAGPVPMFERDPKFKVTLAAGTRWAKPEDDEPGAVGRLRKAVRERFGGTIVRLDYDRDGKPDLLLLAAVVREGKLGDLLLHNDGGGAFTDVTAAVGIGAFAGFGCAAADFDNDGFPDLVVTGPTGVRLWRNEDGKRFADRSADAGFDKLTGVFLGAARVDLDQDGDLDLLLARYAPTAEAALDQLAGKPAPPGGVVAMLNVGEAPPVAPGSPPKPLTCKFRPADDSALLVRGPVTSLVVSDLDGDRDPDVLVLSDREPPIVVLNDRLLRFRRGEPVYPFGLPWNGGLVFDANGDAQSDLLLLSPLDPVAILASTTDEPAAVSAKRFAQSPVFAPPLLQAQAVDLNLDGLPDLVGLSRDRKPILLLNDGGGRFTHRIAPFGPEAEVMPNLLAVAVCDYDGDETPDLLAWSGDAGLVGFRNLGVGNRALTVTLTGKRDKGNELRTNADGIGAVAFVLTGPLRTFAENTTPTAGLGQSRVPLVFGLGKAATADTIQVRWPDGTPQTELALAAGAPAAVVETNRKGVSCPVLLTWDGTRFRYVTDFLGAGSMGELSADGSTRPPRAKEAVKIEPGQLVARNGKFVLKVAEPMDEVTYLDHLRLDVIDHPAGDVVYPDERFATGGPDPTQEPLAFRERFAATKATDHHGRDVTETLRTRDGKTVDGFARRSWLGFAEEHFVTLDFGAAPKGKPLVLVLAGWTDYPYPESIFAAAQAGVPVLFPVLERKTPAGTWEKVCDLGFPAGLPRVITRDVSELAGATGLTLRIRTNLQIYWDQIFLAPVAGKPAALPLLPTKATLARRGFIQEVAGSGSTPIEYNDDRLEPVAVTRWRGKLTRLGDITPLLSKVDDRFVVIGPGDEVTVEFDEASMPPVKPGFVRSFVLRTHGYCKDSSLYTATSGDVGPLPYRGMTSFPDGARDRTKAPAGQDAYDREWNTRPAGGSASRGPVTP